MIRFIDVSVVQGAIQFDKVAAAGIRAVVVKCTEGMGGADPRYQANVRGAREAGLEVGAYHFCKASLSPGMQNLRDDAVGEMQRFHALANFDAGPINFPPVLDFEIFDGQTPAMAAEWLRIAIMECEGLWGRPPVIYTGAPMEKALTILDGVAPAMLRRCPLWIAAYPQSKLASGAWSPAITWEQAAAREFPTVAPWKAALMHQFSGGSNTLPGNYVDGIKPFVDCNLFNGGESEWRTFLGLDVVHPPEVGSPAGEDDPPEAA